MFYVSTCLIFENCEGGLSYIQLNMVIHLQVMCHMAGCADTESVQ